MIIKLTGADFSTSNIGKIDIRTAPDAATQILLNTYGKTTWTLTQELAINDFLLGFNAAAWKSKVKRLVMPILAPADTIIKNEQGVFFYDLISASNLTALYGPAYTYLGANTPLEIRANGLINPNAATISNGNDYFGINYNVDTTLTLNNFHYGVYSYKDATDQNLSTISASIGVGATNFMEVITEDLFSIGYYSAGVSGDVKGYWDVNTKFVKGFRIGSYNGTLMNGLSCNSPLSSVSYRNTSPLNTSSFNSTLISRNLGPNKTQLSLITIGEYLTQSELFEYNALVSTLMNALWTV